MNDEREDNARTREAREGTPYGEYGKACGTISVIVVERGAGGVGQFAQPQQLATRTKEVCAGLGIETRPVKFPDGSAAVNTVVISRPRETATIAAIRRGAGGGEGGGWGGK